MPTGYTASIKNGISFKDFVLQCARAMGVCITMRDDPIDKEIPKKFEPSTWHKNRIKEAREALGKLNNLTLMQIDKKAKQEYDKEDKVREKAINERNDLSIKYKTMLSQVITWHPPTSDHQELRTFMIDHITRSIDFDCNSSYYLDKKITLLTSQQWLEKEKVRLLHDLNYHIKEDMEEQKRVAGKNKWIKALRESL